jgi:hypothetical protein
VNSGPGPIVPLDAEEREVAELTRKVMNLSLIFVFLSLVSCLDDVRQGRVTDALWWLMVSLAMPYCGYYGARNKDRNLLCMFYSINLAIAVMYVLVVLLIFVFIQAIDPAVQECLNHEPEGTFEEDVRMDDPEAEQGVGGDGAAHDSEPMTTEQCEYWTRAQSHKFDLYMQLIIYSCQIFLNCSAFSNGKRLATLPHLSPGDVDSRYIDRRSANAERGIARRQRAMELAMQRRQGNIVHAQVVEAVAVPVVIPPPSHPRLRPGEVQARAVFEVETTRNPAMAASVLPGGEHGEADGGGANGSPSMGTIVMGEAVYDDVEDPVCPASSDQRT